MSHTSQPEEGRQSIDVEKTSSLSSGTIRPLGAGYSDKWSKQLLLWGVEARGTLADLTECLELRGYMNTGIRPVQPEERTDTQFSKIFFIWFTMNFNILSYEKSSLYLKLYLSSLQVLGRHFGTGGFRTGLARLMSGYLILQPPLLRSSSIFVRFSTHIATQNTYFTFRTTWGPKLGLRQMVQARYSFG